MDQKNNGITIPQALVNNLTIRPFVGPTPIRVQQVKHIQLPQPVVPATHRPRLPVNPPIRVIDGRQRNLGPLNPTTFELLNNKLVSNITFRLNQPSMDQSQGTIYVQQPIIKPPVAIPRPTPVVINRTNSIVLPANVTIRPVGTQFRIIQSTPYPIAPVAVMDAPGICAPDEQRVVAEPCNGAGSTQGDQDVVLDYNEDAIVTLTKVTQNNNNNNSFGTMRQSSSETLDLEVEGLNESSGAKLSDLGDEGSEIDSGENSFITNEENPFEYADCSSLIENATKEESGEDEISPTSTLEEWNIDKQDEVEETENPKTDDAPEEDTRTLGWHIQRALERHNPNSGMKTLDIQHGVLTDRKSNDNLIVRMNGDQVVQSLRYELKFLADQATLPSWKPALRHDRLRSEMSLDMAPLRSDRKRRMSMAADLEIDERGEYKRAKLNTLLCDEELVQEESWDEQSMIPEDPFNVSDERVLMPSPVFDFKFECDVDDEFITQPLEDDVPKAKKEKRRRSKKSKTDTEFILVKAEGKQMFNADSDIWETNRAKVRQCFRPRTSDFGSAMNGFDLLNWQSNVGVLWGSNLNFSVNDLGLIDIITKCDDDGGKDTNEDPLHLPAYNDDKDDHDMDNVDSRDAERESRPNSQFWDAYMEKTQSFAAPRYMFKHVEWKRHHLAKGMNIEVVDPKDPCGPFVPATVVATLGGRVGVHLANQPQIYYYNDNSWELMPVGSWKRLKSSGTSKREKRTQDIYTPGEHLGFEMEKYKGPLKLGMFVEAHDWHGDWTNGRLRPAMVTRLLRNRVLITFVGRSSKEAQNSYWCSTESALIHPHGYHKGTGLKFPTSRVPKDANWATRRDLPGRPPRPFKVGMQLEAVDRVNPSLIRPATVLAIQGYEIQIGYDGFPKEHSYWVFDDSEDIFPIEWCAQNGHRLEPVKKKTECKIYFCGGAGHADTVSARHTKAGNCPYDFSSYFGILQRNANVADRCTRFPKLAPQKSTAVKRGTTKIKLVYKNDPQTDVLISTLEQKLIDQTKRIKSWNVAKDYGPRYKQNLGMWEEHSQRLTEALSGRNNPMMWTCAQVKYFISQVPNCRYLGGVFEASQIDGEALLSLCESDLTDVMSLKLGLAIKIYNAIVVLRNRYMKEIVGSPEQWSTK